MENFEIGDLFIFSAKYYGYKINLGVYLGQSSAGFDRTTTFNTSYKSTNYVGTSTFRMIKKKCPRHIAAELFPKEYAIMQEHEEDLNKLILKWKKKEYQRTLKK
jgi:hypothetical protein